MKNENKLESNLKTLLRLCNFYIQNHGSKSKQTNKIIRKIIASLDDPKAKVANRLSLCRVPLGLTIPITANITKNQWAVLGMSGFYAISDFLDGFYSKHVIHHPTEGGSYLDAGCDKIGAIELIIPAIIQNPGFLVNGALESIISKINTDSVKKGIDVKSTKLGKLKMWPLSLALICSYMSHTGLEVGKLKLSKQDFQKFTNILIPLTAALETINISQYYNMSTKTPKDTDKEYILIEEIKSKTLKSKKI